MADMRRLIVETANSLGMNPEDLATIISYETGGTFSPTQPGPTTQWGQHRGLIQFGEPQAKEHGVDFSSPEAALASQLGPNGAVAKYFRANGWKPGMSMMNAYSIVNTGGPGRFNASDANNGGAPGTVADKVTGQMAGHRAKAVALLGGSDAGDAPGERGGHSRLAYAYANGKMTPEDAALYRQGMDEGYFPKAKTEDDPSFDFTQKGQSNPLDVYQAAAMAPRRQAAPLMGFQPLQAPPQQQFAPLFQQPRFGGI